MPETAPTTTPADGDGIPDVTQPAVTPPYLDKKFWAALFTVTAPLLLKLFGVPIDPNLLAIVFAGVGCWYMQLHNSKSTKITVANIEHQAAVVQAHYEAMGGTKPEDAAKLADQVGRG